MKKIISLLSALAIFSSMTVTGFAGVLNGKDLTGENSEPKVQVWIDEASSTDTYAVAYVKVINNEELSFFEDWGDITSNGVSALQITLKVDTTVFDGSKTRGQKHSVVSGATLTPISDGITFAYGPGSASDYLTTIPEYLFMARLYYQTGKTLADVASDDISFYHTKVEYKSYAGTPDIDTYTIYGANLETGTAYDYDLACKFTGTSTEWPEEGGEGEVTLVAGVDEITTEGRHQGKASFSASTGVATKGLTKITVKNSTDADRVEEWIAPTTLGDGITKVLPIVTYNKVAELIDSIFTVEFYNEDGVFKTLTYTVQ